MFSDGFARRGVGGLIQDGTRANGVNVRPLDGDRVQSLFMKGSRKPRWKRLEPGVEIATRVSPRRVCWCLFFPNRRPKRPEAFLLLQDGIPIPGVGHARSA